MQYRTQKIANLLLFLFLADVLAFAAWYGSTQSRSITKDGGILRKGHGGGEREVTARLETSQTTTEEEPETYVIVVDAQTYTEQEAKALADSFFTNLPMLIGGDNQDLLHVNCDLVLKSRYEGYPFQVEWKSSRYSLLGTDGTVHVEDLGEGMSEEVTLNPMARYENQVNEHTLQVTLTPVRLSPKERFRQEVESQLAEENTKTITEKTFWLPKNVDGVALTWLEEPTDDSAVLFVLIAAAGIIGYWMSDRELHRKIEQRQREMTIDYPQILSKMVLFLGAGMSVRNIFQKLGMDYTQQKQKGGKTQYVYEEILLVCHALDSGVSAYDAYTHFGMRCRMRQYIKLCSLLTQNLRKGNAALLSALQEEADLAFVERKNIARQLGEEAGTKLLLPMMMMLAVTLIIIIIPAYYSFSI